MKNRKTLIALMVFLVLPCLACASEKRVMTYEDIMKFRALQSPALSYNGRWIAYTTAPDRGDPEVVIKSLFSDMQYKLARASSPVISRDVKWVAAVLNPKAIDLENAEKDKPKKGMVLFSIADSAQYKYDNISRFAFSNDSKWMVCQGFQSESTEKDTRKDYLGSDVTLRHLETGSELVVNFVNDFAFDSLSNYFAYSVSEPGGKKNGLYYIDLKGSFTLPMKIIARDSLYFNKLSWNNSRLMLAFIQGHQKKDGHPDSLALRIWDIKTKEITEVVNFSNVPKDWKLPFKNTLTWTKDGNRLYFGLKPKADSIPGENKVTFSDTTYYDVNTILKKSDLDVWHWNDPRIKTNQRNWWDKFKDNTYLSVYNLETKKFFQLAGLDLPQVEIAENPDYTIGYNDLPYMKDLTWYGEIKDLYLVDLRTGAKKLLVPRMYEDAYLSPGGKYVTYFKDRNWHQYSTHRDTTAELTKKLEFQFDDEDWDQPGVAPSYGLAGWQANDEAVFIYDKYDIWKFYTGSESFICQTATEARDDSISMRIVNLDKDRVYLKTDEWYFMSGFDEKTKDYGVYRFSPDILGFEKIVKEPTKRYNILAKAKEADRMIFTRESYDEFPDLWVTDSAFSNPRKVTDINPEMKDYLWGKTELVHWVNFDGDTLDGYIIKPDNFVEGRKYPLLVYFYERFSSLMHFFYQPRINHRPAYQMYSGDGYMIFVPDIKYRIGQPGYSAVSAVVSGVRSLARAGLVDTTAVGIQGHSWGGYETAYMITQTDLFAAAAAGAPVGNMTSAYSGIRLESGMTRQFQYEAQQSRIGGTLWDSLDNYINNSPVFQLKKVRTPLLIEFGDEDEAVPWQQGIELYMTMRRLSKNVIMLQYHKEPHHPRKYQNKLDYAIRMKEFFDTYLKKQAPPEWIIKGVEFKGK